MKLFRILAPMAFTAFAIVGLGEISSPLTAADTKAEKKAERLKAKAEAKKKMDDAAKKADEAKKAGEAKKAEESKAAELVDKRKADNAKKTVGTQDASAVAKLIDGHVDSRLKKDNVSPSPLSSDADFLRRVYLDITGVIPPYEKAKAFLDDKLCSSQSRAS